MRYNILSSEGGHEREEKAISNGLGSARSELSRWGRVNRSIISRQSAGGRDRYFTEPRGTR